MPSYESMVDSCIPGKSKIQQMLNDYFLNQWMKIQSVFCVCVCVCVCVCACACMLSHELCDPMEGSFPDSSVCEIFQARVSIL